MYSKKKPFTDIAINVHVKTGHVTKGRRIGRFVRHNKGEHARKGLGA